MKISFTARDSKFFLLGIFAAFIFSVIYDWEDNVKALKEGFAQGIQGHPM